MKYLSVFLILLLPIVALSTVTIYVVSQPFVEVYVNGSFVGCTNFSGQFSLTISSTDVSLSITVSSPYYIQMGPPQVISIGNVQAFYIPMVPAGYIRIFSNSYPVDVFADGTYVGRVNGVSDRLKVPARDVELKLVSPGKNPVIVNKAVPWKSTVSVNVEFEEKPLSIKVIPSYEEFSPNGDWYRDEVKFHVYLSRPELFELTVYGDHGKVKRFVKKGTEGDNLVTWDGKDENGKVVPDGIYKVVARCGNLVSETHVVVSTTNYTYTKEITLAVLFILLAVGIASLVLSLQM